METRIGHLTILLLMGSLISSLISLNTIAQDRDGPITYDMTVEPSIVLLGSTVWFNATMDDTEMGRSVIESAEFFVDTIGENGTGIQMRAEDDIFDETVERVIWNGGASWTIGTHVLYVHGCDMYLNWGGFSTAIFQVLGQPDIRLEVSPQTLSVEPSEEFPLFVFFNNSGLGLSESVWINISLPSGLTIVGDTSSHEDGTRVGVGRWFFANVDTGKHSFQIDFTFQEYIPGAGNVSLSFVLNYTDALGGNVRSITSTALIKVYSPSQVTASFPFTVLIGSFVLVGALLAVAFSSESVRYRGLSLILPLWARLKKKDVLSNEIRGMIRGYLMANPGAHFSSILDSLKLASGTLVYHLRVLEKEGIIKSWKEGRYRRFAPSGLKVGEIDSYLTEIEEVILEMIRRKPGIDQKRLAEESGMARSTISYHMKKLSEMNLVESVRKGLRKRYTILPKIDVSSPTAQ